MKHLLELRGNFRLLLMVTAGATVLAGVGQLRAQQQFGPSPQMQYRASQYGPTPELAVSNHFGPSAQDLYHQHPNDSPTYVSYGGQQLAPRYVAINGTAGSLRNTSRASVSRRDVPITRKKVALPSRTNRETMRPMESEVSRGADAEEQTVALAEVHPIHLSRRTAE